MKRWRNKQEFKAHVLKRAAELDVTITWLAVRPMKHKWASCSTAGHLNFSSDLLALDRALGDFVAVHELLHVRVPNHGKLWKSLMRVHLGDYEALEKRLQRKTGTLLRTRQRRRN